jgi:hypothetical protein
MRYLTILVCFISVSAQAGQGLEAQVRSIAKANGFKPNDRIVNAVAEAARTYKVDVAQLTAIGIIETGLGKYTTTRVNKNGTLDKGLFQINTVNHSKCVAYHLDTPEGSALCAAKLLSMIKKVKPDDIAKYHSKTPKYKARYFKKITKVLSAVDRSK